MANAWLAHVKATMKSHKGMKFKDVLKQAKKTYKKSAKASSKKNRVKSRKLNKRTNNNRKKNKRQRGGAAPIASNAGEVGQ